MYSGQKQVCVRPRVSVCVNENLYDERCVEVARNAQRILRVATIVTDGIIHDSRVVSVVSNDIRRVLAMDGKTSLFVICGLIYDTTSMSPDRKLS